VSVKSAKDLIEAWFTLNLDFAHNHFQIGWAWIVGPLIALFVLANQFT